jgi:anti-sigma B factor antagonist
MLRAGEIAERSYNPPNHGGGVTKKDENSKVDFGTSSYAIRTKKIDVRGDVDMTTAPKLREKIQAALAAKPQVIILNLSDVTRMDSAGVAVLVEGIQWARREKIILSLQEVSRAAQAVLEMARVDKLFQVSGNNYVPPLK